jgi:hypothetical protein
MLKRHGVGEGGNELGADFGSLVLLGDSVLPNCLTSTVRPLSTTWFTQSRVEQLSLHLQLALEWPMPT